MQILFITLNTFSKVGGIQTFNKYFIQSLSDNNYNFKVLSLHDKCDLEDPNIITFDSNYIKFIISIILNLKPKTKIICGHISLGIFLLIAKLYFNKISTILITHGTEAWKQKIPIRKKLSFFLSDQIWSVSKYTKNLLIKNHNLKENKIKVFPNCIKQNNKLFKLNPFNKNNFNIFTMLRLDDSPKLDAVFSILKILPSLIDSIPNIYFTIIGYGNKFKYIEEFISINSLNKYVELKGFIKDPRPYFQYCDIFSLISDGEGFGIVYLEAMQYEKCCIASKNCGAEEVILNDFNGFCINHNDLKSLKNKINYLHKNSKIRINMGKKGKIHFKNNFTYDKFCNRQKTFLGK